MVASRSRPGSTSSGCSEAFLGEVRPRAGVRAPSGEIALFLQHLWATDGSLTLLRSGQPRIYYSSISRQLAIDVQSLLLRLGIVARVGRIGQRRGRDQHPVDISGRVEQFAFLALVGCHGARGDAVEAIPCRPRATAGQHQRRRDPEGHLGPRASQSDAERRRLGRELARRIGMQYCGSALYKTNVSRERLGRVAAALEDPGTWPTCRRPTSSGIVSWRSSRSGRSPCSTPPSRATHNFLANGVVAHNSIEQDADVVMFIYRDEVYNKESADKAMAEVRSGSPPRQRPCSRPAERSQS